MDEKRQQRRMIVAILLTSTLLTMLGVSGMITGAADLSMEPLPEDLEEVVDLVGDKETRERSLQLVEARATNPYRRPFAATNIVVSGLVLIGSFMLSWRRRLSQWWIKQAVAAKLLWITAYTVSIVSHLRLEFPLSSEAVTDTGTIVSDPAHAMILAGVISGVLHLGAAWRATRKDIGQFIASSADLPKS